MSTTPTTHLGWLMPDVPTEENNWGDLLRDIWTWQDLIEGGNNAISVAGSSTTTLTADQAKPRLQTFTGTLTGNKEVHFPASNRFYLIRNGTSGSFTLTAKISGGTGVVLPQGKVVQVYFDGTDCRLVFDPSSIASNVAITGDLAVTGDVAVTGDITLTDADAGAAAGPTATLYRNSASPAASDVIGAVLLDGEDGAGNQQTYARLQGIIDDPTSTSEDGRLSIGTVVAGTLANRLHVGAGVYTEGVTGGDPGAGIINAADFEIGGESVKTRTINAQTGTTYTFVLGDAVKFNTFDNGSSITVTVPPNSDVAFPVGTQLDCAQLGAGQVTFAQGSGVTINSENSAKKLSAQYTGGTLLKTATDTWLLIGSLTS